MNETERVIKLQTSRITARVGGPGGNCRCIVEVDDGVFDIFGMRPDGAIVRVYREPGMIVELEGDD